MAGNPQKGGDIKKRRPKAPLNMCFFIAEELQFVQGDDLNTLVFFQ